MSQNNAATTQSQNRPTPAVIDQRRSQLATALAENDDIVKTIPVVAQEKFKQSFLDMITQDYLISVINPREILRFVASIARAGLSINASDKEVYIVPFDTKVQGQKVMLPQAIIPLNGIQQQAYSKGFMFNMYSVYKIGEEYASELDMTRAQQAQLRTSDPQWVDANFIGFDVVLTDLRGELPTQTKFVEGSYLKEVTKTIQDPRFKIQNWRHKAARRANGDFIIPRERKLDIFDEIEHANDTLLAETNAVLDVVPEVKKIDATATPGSLAEKVASAKAVATQSQSQAIVDTELVVKEFKDLADLGIALSELGLEMTTKEQGGKTYALISGGNIEGLENTLAEYGFSKGKKDWGMDVTKMVANEADDAFK